MARRAIFLDRDGVINRFVYNSEFGTVDSPSSPEEFELLPGVVEAIAALHRLGALLVVVSNQPGIAKGRFSMELLQAVTHKMLLACGGQIEAVRYCLHHPSARRAEYRMDCNCRKPKPGLLLQAAADMQIDLRASVMIGDGLTDIQAGIAAGTRTILVSPRKCYLCDAIVQHNAVPDSLVSTLAEAVPVVKQWFEPADPLKGEIPHELHHGLSSRGYRDYREFGR